MLLKSKVTFPVFFMMAILFFNGTVFAAECPFNPNQERDADIVVVGKATDIKYTSLLGKIKHIMGGFCGPKIVTLSVSRHFKGDVQAGQELKVETQDACKGSGGYFTEGKEYIVYAKKVKRDYQSDACYGTAEINEHTQFFLKKAEKYFNRQ